MRGRGGDESESEEDGSEWEDQGCIRRVGAQEHAVWLKWSSHGGVKIYISNYYYLSKQFYIFLA